jgi:phosphinothricin acetyltransferase
MGFRQLATYRDVGFKLGAWHDVGWWALRLGDPPVAPEPPLAFPALDANVVNQALALGTEQIAG